MFLTPETNVFPKQNTNFWTWSKEEKFRKFFIYRQILVIKGIYSDFFHSIAKCKQLSFKNKQFTEELRNYIQISIHQAISKHLSLDKIFFLNKVRNCQK